MRFASHRIRRVALLVGVAGGLTMGALALRPVLTHPTALGSLVPGPVALISRAPLPIPLPTLSIQAAGAAVAVQLRAVVYATTPVALRVAWLRYRLANLALAAAVQRAGGLPPRPIPGPIRRPTPMPAAPPSSSGALG